MKQNIKYRISDSDIGIVTPEELCEQLEPEIKKLKTQLEDLAQYLFITTTIRSKEEIATLLQNGRKGKYKDGLEILEMLVEVGLVRMTDEGVFMLKRTTIEPIDWVFFNYNIAVIQ